MSDQPAEPQDVTVVEDLPQRSTAEADAEPDTFPREYVQALRKEAADHRAKAKKVTDANARLMALHAEMDGRLINVSELAYTDDLVDDSGLVDPQKVAQAIDALIESKPYLRKSAPPISQGVMPRPPDEPSLFDLLRQRI